MFKNAQVFTLSQKWEITADQLHAQLSKLPFVSCGSQETQTQGWISPRGNDLLVHNVHGQFLMTLATEKKLLPSSVINQVTKARAAELEDQQGFAPGRKAMKELKERVTDELLSRAFTQRSNINVWLDLENGWLVIDAGAPAKADAVVKMLLKCCDKLPLEALRTKSSPQAAMTGWLASDEAPHKFTIDQDAELRSTNESKATVRYARHTLEHGDVAQHIAAGKECTRLALTWNDRISFVLTDNLTIKRIKPLDVVDEANTKGVNEEERFDSDFTLMAGELGQLLDDLVYALGGFASE
jgi:recombination associated protein RdgC